MLTETEEIKYLIQNFRREPSKLVGEEILYKFVFVGRAYFNKNGLHVVDYVNGGTIELQALFLGLPYRISVYSTQATEKDLLQAKILFNLDKQESIFVYTLKLKLINEKITKNNVHIGGLCTEIIGCDEIASDYFLF